MGRHRVWLTSAVLTGSGGDTTTAAVAWRARGSWTDAASEQHCEERDEQSGVTVTRHRNLHDKGETGPRHRSRATAAGYRSLDTHVTRSRRCRALFARDVLKRGGVPSGVVVRSL